MIIDLLANLFGGCGFVCSAPGLFLQGLSILGESLLSFLVCIHWLCIQMFVFWAFLLHWVEYREQQDTEQTHIISVIEHLYCLHHKHKNSSDDRQGGLYSSQHGPSVAATWADGHWQLISQCHHSNHSLAQRLDLETDIAIHTDMPLLWLNHRYGQHVHPSWTIKCVPPNSAFVMS